MRIEKASLSLKGRGGHRPQTKGLTMVKRVKSQSAESKKSSSSQRGHPTKKSVQPLPPLSPQAVKRLKRLAKISDDEIDYSDIPPLTQAQLDSMVLVPATTRDGKRDYNARVAEAMADQQKKPISLRVEPSVLAWFKAQGPRYQSRMNAVLRAYMETHRL